VAQFVTIFGDMTDESPCVVVGTTTVVECLDESEHLCICTTTGGKICYALCDLMDRVSWMGSLVGNVVRWNHNIPFPRSCRRLIVGAITKTCR